MKDLLLKLKSDIQKGNKPEGNTIEHIMFKLSEKENDCITHNTFDKMPTIEDLNNTFNSFQEISYINNKSNSPMLWSNLYSLTNKEIEHLEAIGTDKENIEQMRSDFSVLDGWQVFSEESSVKEEVSTIGVGVFDAMFMNMENKNIKKENEKEKNFSIKENNGKTYVKFKSGNMTENSFFNKEKLNMFSAITINEYKRINFLQIFNDGTAIQFFVSYSKESDKKQMSIYLLDENGSIETKTESFYNVLQFISIKNEDGYLKFINFKDKEINDFNSFIFSLKDNKTIFKGITSIIKKEKSHEFFNEPKYKGFEFPYIEEHKDHKEVKNVKLEESLNFTISKNQGEKTLGDKANRLKEELLQPELFLLEDFSDLEIRRIAYNIKEQMNISKMDVINFGQKQKLIELLDGNLYKFEALNTVDVFSSNVNPIFGEIVHKELFSITKQDIMVKDYAEYKSNVITDSIISDIQNQVKTKLDNRFSKSLKGYVFSSRLVETIDEKLYNRDLLGEVVFSKKENINKKYRAKRIDKDILENLLLEEFKLTNVCQDTFLLDRRRFYESNLKERLISLGAEEIDFIRPNVEEIPEILLSVNTKEIKDSKENVFVNFSIKATDKEYYEISNEIESFSNRSVLFVLTEALEILKDKLIKPTIIEENNFISFTVSTDDLDQTHEILNQFEKIDLEKKIDKIEEIEEA